MTNTTLETILTEHAIPSRDWQAIKELTYNGTRPSNALLQRLRSIASYSAALSSILIELSKEVKYKFPPKNWKPSRNVA
jgi:hypothetical protein